MKRYKFVVEITANEDDYSYTRLAYVLENLIRNKGIESTIFYVNSVKVKKRPVIKCK